MTSPTEEEPTPEPTTQSQFDPAAELFLKHRSKLADKDVEREEAVIIAESMQAAKREARRMEQKPDLTKLADAIVYLEDGTPVFVPDVGEHVIIEKFATVLLKEGQPVSDAKWLETKQYQVKSIDHDLGTMKLYDEEKCEYSMSNFVTGPSHGYKFKLPKKPRAKKTQEGT